MKEAPIIAADIIATIIAMYNRLELIKYLQISHVRSCT